MTRPKLGTQFKALLGFAQAAVKASSTIGGGVSGVHQALEVVERDVFATDVIHHFVQPPNSISALPVVCRSVSGMVGKYMADMPCVLEEVTDEKLAKQGIECGTMLAVKELYPSLFGFAGISMEFFDQALNVFLAQGGTMVDFLSSVTTGEANIFRRLYFGDEVDQVECAEWMARDTEYWTEKYGEALDGKITSGELSNVERAILQNKRIAELSIRYPLELFIDCQSPEIPAEDLVEQLEGLDINSREKIMGVMRLLERYIELHSNHRFLRGYGLYTAAGILTPLGYLEEIRTALNRQLKLVDSRDE